MNCCDSAIVFVRKDSAETFADCNVCMGRMFTAAAIYDALVKN